MKQKIFIKTKELSKQKLMVSDTIIVFAFKGAKLNKNAQQLWDLIGSDFLSLAKSAKFSGNEGEVLDLLSPANIKANRLLVFGVGEQEKVRKSKDYRNLGGIIAKKIAIMNEEKISIIFESETPDEIAELAAGIRLSHYKFEKYKTKKHDKEEKQQPKELIINFLLSDKAKTDKSIKDKSATIFGTLLARDLVNEPSNHLGPIEFAQIARELSDIGVDVDILTPVELKKLGMGALLAVAQGSSRPARLVVMQWHGGKKQDAPIAFVGKGVVFDSGGISIKPAGSMEDMKGDMGGAAAVTGLMKAIALRKAKANIVGIIGLCENMPDGNSYRPGDIIKSMSGQTIEIINTDAEGRLVLADALWYTQQRFKPKYMVNLATLTGAIMVGLGQEYAGLFSNNDDLAKKLIKAGEHADEKLWRMPLSKAYDKMIDSRFADMKNTGGRYGGAITAAQFLQRFVNGTDWAHLDIAGTGFATQKSHISNSWAPGFGVALLDQFIRDNFEK